VDFLKKFQFNGEQITYYAGRLASNIYFYGTKSGEFRAECTLDIGKFGEDEYAVLIEQLSADSFNAVNLRNEKFKTRIYRSLQFTNVKAIPRS
jgi:hypothetical protein